MDTERTIETGVDGLVRLCNERAETYGALRQSSLTAVALDRAADALLALKAEVEELRGALRKLVELDSDGENGCAVDPIEYGDALESARAILSGESVK